SGAPAPQAVAGEIDAMGVVNQPIEDGVGISRVADEGVPFVDRNLAGEDGRATSVAFLEDFVEVTTGTGIERFEAPVVEDEELDAGEAAQDAGISAVTAGEREFRKQLGNPLIENRAVVAAMGELTIEQEAEPVGMSERDGFVGGLELGKGLGHAGEAKLA